MFVMVPNRRNSVENQNGCGPSKLFRTHHGFGISKCLLQKRERTGKSIFITVLPKLQNSMQRPTVIILWPVSHCIETLYFR